MTEKIKSRADFTLENVLRVQFHPTGMRTMMYDLSKELNIGKVGTFIGVGIGTSFDVLKEAAYCATAYVVVLNYLK